MAKQSKLHGSHLKLQSIWLQSIWLHSDEKSVLVKAYDVPAEVIRFFTGYAKVPKLHVHRDYRDDGSKAKTWAVTEASTGACVTRSQSSPDAAVIRACHRMVEKGEAEFYAAVERTEARRDEARKRRFVRECVAAGAPAV